MKVVIVDDDKLVAMSLKTIIGSEEDCEVVAVLNSGEEIVREYGKLLPDVLLMDIRMQGMTGIDAGREILKEHSDAKILYLTTFNDGEYIQNALMMGAKGYIIKQDFEGIVPSIKAVYLGQTVFGSEVVSHLKAGGDAPKDKYNLLLEKGLTELEARITVCVSQGLSNKEIADKLALSEGTVRNYLSNILAKLDLRDRTNLAIYYYDKI